MSTPSDQLDVRLAAILAKLKSRSADLERGRRWPLPPEDPDLRKHLARLCDALGDLLRLQRIGGPQPEDEPRLHELLHAFEQPPDSEMTRDDAWMALYETQLFLIDAGDADVVCGMVGSELRWHQTDTSWLTWNAYFGSAELPEVVERYRKGERVSKPELAACRNQLQELVRARHYDEEAHRSRAEQRSRNLAVLAAGLLALIPCSLPSSI